MGAIILFAKNSQTIFKLNLNRPYQTTLLNDLAGMSSSSQTSTDQTKMLHPKEIEKKLLMMEEVVKILEETFLNSFSDDLDKKYIYNIVYGKTVSTEIKDSLITIDEKETILEYTQSANKENVTDSMMMDVIKKIKIKYLLAF